MPTQSPDIVDYAPAVRSRGGVRSPTSLAVLSFGLCVFQFGWIYVAGLAFWMFVTGDNEPTGFQTLLFIAVAGAPSILALVLGGMALAKATRPITKAFGVLGVVGSVVWLVLLVRMI